MPDKGNAGVRGGPAGDLYVDREGGGASGVPARRRRLHMIVPIAVHEAALGRAGRGPTPDGRAAAHSAGHAVGPAFPAARARRAVDAQRQRGDLVVEVRMMLPRVLDERSKELLREFGKINGESPCGSSDDGQAGRARQGVLHDQRGGAEVRHPSRRRCGSTSGKGC